MSGKNFIGGQHTINTKNDFEVRVDMSNLSRQINWQYLSKTIIDLWKESLTYGKNLISAQNLNNIKKNLKAMFDMSNLSNSRWKYLSKTIIDIWK